ncbi:MAG: hypothetical protein HKO65_10690, partial [Gemmatimonadetes bacterium]|nr:hypothetical protein [Gemmatimonadota bacterium]
MFLRGIPRIPRGSGQRIDPAGRCEVLLTRELLRSLPKAELHVHLDGSLRPSTMLELAGDLGVRLPESEPEALAAAVKVSGSGDLVEYLEKFGITLPLMQTPGALE